VTCNRCGFPISCGKDVVCTNCGEKNNVPQVYYRVDAQNYMLYWTEHMRTSEENVAVSFRDVYRREYPGCPCRVKKVTEEDV
jgi:hypothetical protein